MTSRDRRVAARWSLEGQPRGLAFGPDGTLYVGLAGRQSVAAVDATKGSLLREVVLDSAEIAATKEFATLRVDAPRNRLIIAQGDDESVSILSLPDLAVVREITLEGEVVRDALPDPAGRFLYVLGRTVHVFDAAGEREIAAFSEIDPMAIAASSDGKVLAIVGSEEFANGKATVVGLYDPATLREIAREPLQTDRVIQAALFASDDKALVVAGRDWLAEKSLIARPPKTMDPKAPRISFAFGDLVSSEKICLAANSGPQVLTPGRRNSQVLFAERRCGETGTFVSAPRKVVASSVYGIPAWAVAYERSSDSLWVTDPAGFLTKYKAPAEGK